jgi:3-phenylpropionate/trans-cinnamate dioxygenase ferredoxin reductase component
MAEMTTVIVGASVGGVRTAQALRGAHYPGRIVLLSDETELPYDKPPLSKGLLAGTTTRDEVSLLTRAEARRLGIDIRRNDPAVRLDPGRSWVETASGARIDYQHLVIATGARARPSPWGQPEGLHLLRTLADAEGLRADLLRGGRLVIIGGGVIGAEIAATARSMGLTVTIVDPAATPMERVLGGEIGQRFTRLHQRHGVRTLFACAVREIHGQRGAFQVYLTDGQVLAADYVVVGIGAIPNDEWMATSGLTIEDGVVCDQYCRAVGARTIFAVGDVAHWHNPRHGRLTRTEHWTNATEQAAVVAHNVVHPDDPIAYAPIEYVWSDQYDWKIRVAGEVGTANGEHVEVIGDDAHTGRFAGLYSRDGHTFTGIVVVNWPKALNAGRKALAERTPYPAIRQALTQLTSPRPPAQAGARP